MQGPIAMRYLLLSLSAGLTACAPAPEPANPSAATASAPSASPPAVPEHSTLTMQDVLAASTADDWRDVDPSQLLRLELPDQRLVWIELAPAFAPNHVSNIKALVAERYFDGLAILRSQDNFVVQWGDPNAADEALRKPIQQAQRTLKAEFTMTYDRGLPFTVLPDADGYAPQVGFSQGFPAGRDPESKQAWLSHCYGTLGVGRDSDPDSAGGAELYVVTGHAPRQLDRNITVVGRVLRGMEWLSSLPRGTAPLGFYEQAEQRTPILSIQLASALAPEQQPTLQVLRTDTATFDALIEARRNRRDEWYKRPAGHIDLCSVPIPVRDAPAGTAAVQTP
jgi:peptidylprolyl isomerase